MKALTFVLAMLFSVSAAAVESGLFYDPARNGEGINLIWDESGRVSFFLFTYGDHGCADAFDLFAVPSVSPSIPEIQNNCHTMSPRWFMSDIGRYDPESQEVTGFLYCPFGVNYPDGVPDPVNPFHRIVGRVQTCGFYILKRWGDGWQLLITRHGPFLFWDDPIFGRVFHFSTRLLDADG